MPGERTLDTDDGISLREYLQCQIDLQRSADADGHTRIREFYDKVLDERAQTWDSKMTSMQTLFNERHTAQATALAKAEQATEKRFDAVNEFRAQLTDQAATFMPRSESEVRISAVTEKLEANGERINQLELRLSSRLDLSKGMFTGVDKTVAWVFGAVGFMSTIITIAFALSRK